VFAKKVSQFLISEKEKTLKGKKKKATKTKRKGKGLKGRREEDL